MGGRLRARLVAGKFRRHRRGGVVNPEGLRYPDEFVRHKVLDAIGDLALAGAPIQGLYRSYKGGHKLNAHGAVGASRRPDAWTLALRRRRAERAADAPRAAAPARPVWPALRQLRRADVARAGVPAGRDTEPGHQAGHHSDA